MLGALITGGLSLVSGFFGRNDAKKQQKRADAAQALADERNRADIALANAKNTELAANLSKIPHITTNETDSLVETKTSNSVRMADFMKAAEDSGFNPVTFLNSGALSMFADTATTTKGFERNMQSSIGHNAAFAAQLASPATYQQGVAQQIPIPSIGSVVAGAAGAAYGAYSDQKQREADQAFQREMQNKHLEGVQKQQADFMRSFFVPSRQGGNVKTNGQLGAPLVPTEGEVKVTNPFLTRPVDGTVPDAVAWEDRYGEIGGLLGGVSNIFDDLIFNVTGMTHKERGEQTRLATERISMPDLSHNPMTRIFYGLRNKNLSAGTSGGGGW